jgi:dienelactone hydrolase
MKASCWLWVLILAGVLSACSPDVQAPEAVGPASPEAVALSLSTVDPEESLALFEYDRAAPLDIQEGRRWQEDGAVWIDFNYASPKGGRVPARLVIPRGAGPFPGMILQHGGPGTLEDMDGFAREFARYGAVTIMITSPYRRPGGWVITQYMGNTWPMFTRRDLEIKIQTILDLRRAVDILEERPEVDPDRLAYFGVSWGGSMGGLLAGVEDRLKAYVLVVGDGGLVEHTADPGPDGINVHFSDRWAAEMWPTEPLHFVGRAAPAALLFQNGLNDTYVLPYDALRFYTAASEPKTIIWYDADHELPWSFVEDAADWLQPYLGDHLLILGPNYQPYAVIVDRALLAAVMVPLGFFLVYTIRRKYFNWVEEWFWPGAILLLGPLGLALYGMIAGSRDVQADDAALAKWRFTLLIATRTTIALICGLWIGDRINQFVLGSDFRIRFLQVYIAVLLVSWVLTLVGRRRWWVSFPGLVLVANVFWAVAEIIPMILYYNLPINFWLRYPVSTALGIMVSFPLHRWLMHNGWEMKIEADEVRKSKQELSKPLLAVLLVSSYLAMLGTVTVIIHKYSGLTWGAALKMLFGLFP